jgi:membrane protein GlpM
MIPLVLKCLAGAAAVLLIVLFSKSRNFFIAGLIPLFPTFALIAHVVIGTERSPADLRATAAFGLWSLIPYALYLSTVYWLSERVPLAATLAIATAAWVIAAFAIILVWSKSHPAVV